MENETFSGDRLSIHNYIIVLNNSRMKLHEGFDPEDLVHLLRVINLLLSELLALVVITLP